MDTLGRLLVLLCVKRIPLRSVRPVALINLGVGKHGWQHDWPFSVDSNLHFESGWTRKHIATILDTFHSSLNGTIGEGQPHTFISKYKIDVAVVKVPENSKILISKDALDQYCPHDGSTGSVLVRESLYV